MFSSTRSSFFSLIVIVFWADFAFSADNITLVINEVMASNRSINKDFQGQYDDWIEIYNSGNTAVNVGGMYLTDDLSIPTKWRFPTNTPSATTIPAHGYLLIWADENTADSGLHANFKLSADGEDIALFNTNSNSFIDSITFNKQTADISYGRYPDGSNTWQLMASPTPGGRNSSGYIDAVAEPEFSHKRGFYDAPFSVSISSETQGATIYYTLDASEPGIIPTTGQRTDRVYTGPIPIAKTTCLRAIAVKSGFKPTNVVTHTYIFVDDVARQPANPPGWPSDWGYDSEGGGIVPADYERDPPVCANTRPEYP